MAKHLDVELNYIIGNDGTEDFMYPKTKCYYKETALGFSLTMENGGGSIKIPTADIPNWDDAPSAGSPYSATTLRTFLKTNTGA